MSPDWSRWPLLIAAVIGIGSGVSLLQGSEQAQARLFAAYVLILLGSVSLGAFIESRK